MLLLRSKQKHKPRVRYKVGDGVDEVNLKRSMDLGQKKLKRTLSYSD